MLKETDGISSNLVDTCNNAGVKNASNSLHHHVERKAIIKKI